MHVSLRDAILERVDRKCEHQTVQKKINIIEELREVKIAISIVCALNTNSLSLCYLKDTRLMRNI